MRVCIPSYGRAGRVETIKHFPEDMCSIYIPESQRNEYLKHYDRNILEVVPDEEDGNVNKKRNAILRRNKEKYIYMIDDDFRGLRDIKAGAFLDDKKMLWVMFNLLTMAEDAGACLFGFNNTNDPLKFRDFMPFSFTKPMFLVLGIKENDIEFDEGLTRNGDADYYFKHIRRHKIVLRDNRFFPDVGVVGKKNNGGIGAIGFGDGEKLQKRYGKKYVRLDKDNRVIGLTSPLNGI